MSARQRRVRDRSRRSKVAREKALRRRARTVGPGSASAAAVVALAVAGAGVPSSAAASSDTGSPVATSADAASQRTADCATPGSGSLAFTPVNGRLFFTAKDGRHGRELWTSDGTQAGTSLVKDIHPAGYKEDYFSRVAFKKKLFFVAKDRSDERELWRSDGTRKGTVPFKKIHKHGGWPYDLTRSTGKVFFVNDHHHERELWKSDGTRAGTVMVKVVDHDVGYYTYSSYLTDVGGRLFFVAGTGIHSNGYQLWTSDGTRTGTRSVKVFDNSSTANISNLTDADGRLFFSADDGTHGVELWTSDGSRRGTVMVLDINPSTYGGGYFDSGIALTAFDGRVFFSADDGKHGQALWTSDGTAAGTVMVKDMSPDDYGDVKDVVRVGKRLFFTADDGVHGRELWQSDGTSGGTGLVRNIGPRSDVNGNPRSSSPRSLTNVGGRLFFTADDGVHGRELWTSDGTSAGTVQVEDINLGAALRVASSGRADTRHGTRRVTVQVQAAGRLRVEPAHGSLIKAFNTDVDAAGKTKVTIEPTAKGMRKLKRALAEAQHHGREVGKLRVEARFSFTSCAGGTSSERHRYTLKIA